MSATLQTMFMRWGARAVQAMLHLDKKQFVYKFAARVEKVNWHPNTIYILFVCELTSSWEICKEGRVCQWAQVVDARNCSIEPKVGDTRWRSEVNGRDCERARLSTSIKRAGSGADCQWVSRELVDERLLLTPKPSICVAWPWINYRDSISLANICFFTYRLSIEVPIWQWQS